MITTAPLTPWLLLGDNPTMRAGLRLSWFMWSTQMVKRKALSAKARFEIFKRDAFTCQYCGSHPPAVILHVDHVVPVAEGGTNVDTNLVTSCERCNLGKGATSLQLIPASLSSRAAVVAEREKQLRGYSEIMESQRQRIERDACRVVAVMNECFGTKGIRRDWFISVTRFVDRIGVHQCLQAVDLACSKRPWSEPKAFTYFCGICWRLIKEGGHV
jgi:hypothetical protein